MRVLEKNCKAFKEWAIVVDALGRGEQVVIFRKGGISEGPGGFDIEDREFFLFPTYEHQKADSIVSSHQTRLEELAQSRPQDGHVHVSFYASIQRVHKITRSELLDRVAAFHIWQTSLIHERFEWGSEKSIHLLILRVFKLPQELKIPYLSEYGGCKSWVSLQNNFSTAGEPVLSNGDFHRKLHEVESCLE